MTTRKSTLDLSVVDAGTTTLVYASGTLDIATVDQFEARAVAAFERGQEVLVDVSALALCDSTGLGAMVRLHRRAQNMQRQFGLRDPRRQVADVLAMTGIDKVIPVVSSAG